MGIASLSFLLGMVAAPALWVPPKMQFDVVSARLSTHASESRCKHATITLDTDMAGKPGRIQPRRAVAGRAIGLHDQGH